MSLACCDWFVSTFFFSLSVCLSLSSLLPAYPLIKDVLCHCKVIAISLRIKKRLISNARLCVANCEMLKEKRGFGGVCVCACARGGVYS